MLTTGRHVVYEKETPMTNLYLTLLDRLGIEPESIGDSTGELRCSSCRRRIADAKCV